MWLFLLFLLKLAAFYTPLQVSILLYILCIAPALLLLCFDANRKPLQTTPALLLMAILLLSPALLIQHTNSLTEKNSIMANPQPYRIIIYPKDVQKITGCSESTAGRKISLVKNTLGKRETQLLSIKEFCDFYDLNYNDVLKQLCLI